MTRFHPEIREPRDRPPDDPSCTEAIAATPHLLCANLTAAACMLNALWLHLAGGLHYAEVAFDVADGLMRPLAFEAHAVPVSGGGCGGGGGAQLSG